MSTNVGKLTVHLGTDLRELLSGFQRATQRVEQFSRDVSRMGEKISQIGKGWSLAVTAPLAGFGALSLRSAGEFESAMNRVQALTSATADEFQALTAQALQLGRTTQFTASQAADAMGFLAMAGFKTDQVLGAMPSTLQLAAAASLDLARAADITTNILTGYGLTVDELGHANDVLVAAFTSANVDLNMLGESFKYVGPLAKGAGVAFEETAAAIAMMGNAGIQGSMAGTSLRGAITRLLKPTSEVSEALGRLGVRATNSTGGLLPLVEIVRQLEQAGATTSDMMTIFGQRAGPAMAALVDQGSDALEQLTARLADSGGTAQRVADVQLRGLSGAVLQLKSAWEGFQLAIANSGPLQAATNATLRMAAVVNNLTAAWTALAPQTQQAILQFAAVAAAIGPGTVAMGKLIVITGKLLGLLNPVTIGLAAVGAAVWAVRTNWLGMGEAAGRVWQTILDVGTRVLGVLDRAFRPWANLLIASLHTIGQVAVMVFTEYVRDPFVRAFRAMRDWARPVITAIARGLEVLGRLGESAAEKIREAFADAAEGAEEEGASMGSRIAAVMVANFGRDYVGEFTQMVLQGVDRARQLVERALERLRALGAAGAAVTDLENAAASLASIGESVDDAGVVATRSDDAMKALARSVEGVANAFANSLGGAISNLRDALRSFVEYAMRELTALAARFALFKMVTGIFGGGLLSGFFGDSFLGFKLPGRAMGGPVTRGQPYVVGERGPELFVPQQSGRIESNQSLRGSSAPVINLPPLPAPRNPMESARDGETMRWFSDVLRQLEQAGAIRLGTVG